MTDVDPGNVHLQFHLNLLKSLYNQLNAQQAAEKDASASLEPLLDSLEVLVEAFDHHAEDALHLGQQWIGRLLRSQPHLMPLVNRDLLWFFGGDCLHYLEDDEIDRYQRLDELRHEAEARGEVFKREEAKAKLFGLH